MVGISEAIDSQQEAVEKGPRPHLGASQVGKPCERRLVYSFRHATVKRTSGRMLRLFSRGHREEISLISYLRDIGFEVREYAQRLTWDNATGSYATHDWDEDVSVVGCGLYLEDVTHVHAHVVCAELAGVKLRQWSFKDVGGHHAGSSDGMAMNPSDNLRQFPAIPPDTWFKLEFKTYNTKGFAKLLEVGSVQRAKPEHYSQMQEYMHYMRLPFCLYLAVNKNDDSLYDEVVPYNEAAATEAVDRARRAISARQLPPRMWNNPTNFECKFCDHKGTCHFGDLPAKSCRTCARVVPVVEGDAGDWFCTKWNAIIPKTAVPAGCDSWTPITD